MGCEAPLSGEQWVIRWGGREWSEDDLLVGHLMLMVEGYGDDTWDVAPIRGPRRLLCALAALISIEDHLPYEQVIAGLLQEPASRLLEALQLIDSE